MAVKIRLQRHGKKDSAYYHMVVADGRAPRDGKFIEKLGIYNPTTNPATIDIDFNSTIEWMMKGAQPTDTCRAILSYKGVLYKKHLLEGVKKGALTEEQADSKFNKWTEEKSGKILGKHDRLRGETEKRSGERQKAETAAREARAAKQAAKAAAAAASQAEAPAADAPAAEEGNA
jgi:small subunit ribosomal protein S16